MNIILFEPGELDGDRLRLGGRRAEHILAVLRPALGDPLRVGEIRGGSGQGTVVAIGESQIDLRVAPLTGAPAAPPVRLILAVPRPKSVPRIVAAAASLGVASVSLTNAWRVEKSYLDAPALQPGALRLSARLGCEQGGHTWLPDIELHRRLMPLLHQLPAGEARLVAHPRAETAIEDAEIGASTLVAIGPEGGWIDRELATFEDRGFIAVRCLDAIMRSETAVPVMLGQLELLRRGLRSYDPTS